MMLQWVINHIDGIVVLITACLIPFALWLGNKCKQDILDEAEDKLNGATKRLDSEIIVIKEQITLLKQNVFYVDSKQDMVNTTIKEQVDVLAKEIEQLESLKMELQGTREIMLLQNNSFVQQLTDFKEFIKINLFGGKNQ